MSKPAFTLHIQGLCVCVFDESKGRLRVCCLNSGIRDADQIPIHFPTLIAPRDAVKGATAATLRSMRGRLRKPFTDASHFAWDLGERHVTIDGGSGAPAKHQPNLALEHPANPAKPDWDALHWVLAAARYFPDAKVKPGVLEIGAMTNAIVDVTGGICSGGRPETIGKDQTFVWEFREGFQQAVTDTMDVRFDAVPKVEIRSAAGPNNGAAVEFKEGSEAWLVHEATDRDVANEKVAFPSQRGRHLFAFWQAFNNMPDDLRLPRPVEQWQPNPSIVETTFCVILMA